MPGDTRDILLGLLIWLWGKVLLACLVELWGMHGVSSGDVGQSGVSSGDVGQGVSSGDVG